jgi:hypothetical protein
MPRDAPIIQTFSCGGSLLVGSEGSMAGLALWCWVLVKWSARTTSGVRV